MADIPEHVAAYAAGLWHAMPLRNWQQISSYIAAIGMGGFHPLDLEAAALAWSSKHVEDSARRLLERLDRIGR